MSSVDYHEPVESQVQSDKQKPPKGGLLLRILLRWETILFLLLVLVAIIGTRISPYFLDTFNLLNTTFNFVEKAIIALPMILVIVSGEVDISVAGIIAFSSVFMGMAAEAGAGLGALVLIGLGAGLFAGLLNGIIISRLQIPSIAITIGSMSLFRGISYVILGDQAYTNYPDSFAYLGQGFIGDSFVPFPLVVFAIFAIVFGVVLHRTTFGRRLYTIGNNETVARFSGVPVAKYKLITFCLTGLFAGLASILLTSRIGSTRPNIANGWELEIVTIVVLGGVAITGGKGTIGGVILSVLLVGYLRFAMALVNIPGKVMNIVTGFLLIAAILLPQLIGRFQPSGRKRHT
jgi:rhamnose transport system permease protein